MEGTGFSFMENKLIQMIEFPGNDVQYIVLENDDHILASLRLLIVIVYLSAYLWQLPETVWSAGLTWGEMENLVYELSCNITAPSWNK